MVHVVAVLGEHPAGLTQLLWYLAAREGRRVHGVDLWMDPAHLHGVTGLFQRAGACFAKLEAVLGERARLLPQWQLEPLVDPPEDHPFGSGFAVYPFLPREYRRRLDARLRRLPPGVELVGGIAGAPSSRAADLWQVFSSWAPESARILEVTIDSRIAVDVDVRTFVCPEGPVAFVPPEQQVRVENVDFLAICALVERGRLRRADSVLALVRARSAGQCPGGDSPATWERRGRFVVLRLGEREVRLGPEGWALYQCLLDAAPQPVRRPTLLACGPAWARRPVASRRAPETVDRILGTVRGRIEEVVASDPRWAHLVPVRRPAGWWALPGAHPDAVVCAAAAVEAQPGTGGRRDR